MKPSAFFCGLVRVLIPLHGRCHNPTWSRSSELSNNLITKTQLVLLPSNHLILESNNKNCARLSAIVDAMKTGFFAAAEGRNMHVSLLAPSLIFTLQ